MSLTLENERIRYVIGGDGRNRHFIDKATGIDWLTDAPPSPCATARQGAHRVSASAAVLRDGKLRITFGAGGAEAVLGIVTAPRHVVVTVESVSGDIDELAFVNIPTRLQAKAHQPFSAASIALNLQTHVEELPGPQSHLWATAYKRFGLAGARAGIVAAPFSAMRDILKEMVGAAEGVPHSPYGGPWALDAEITRGSYLFGTPTVDDVDTWIDLCRHLGFTQIEFCGCLNYGDYQPFPRLYPNGYRDVRTVTDKLHGAGILAGLHTMSFSIDKTCEWVTPVPDPRLAKERTYTLGDDVAPGATRIPLLEPTPDLPTYIGYYVRRSRTLQIDDELIEYTTACDGPPFEVAGCTRGAHGTAPAPHAKGAPIHHLKECWGCFVPDGESTLFDEVAAKIAAVINECGFDFTYLDGLDGAHVIGGEEVRWYYGAKFAFEVFQRLNRPVMMAMATFHHHLWFVRSRMQAWDHTIRGHKRFIDLHCRSNEGARRLFMPLHLGWSRVLAWQGPEHEATHLDDVEYMWSKGLGTDAGYSLQGIDPAVFAAEPWLQRLAPVIKQYETLRRQGHVTEAVKAQLREPGAEHTLRRSADGAWTFLPVQHARHKVEDADGVSNVWSTANRFGHQPLKLHIETLMGCAPYGAPGNIPLAEFTSADEFSDRGVRHQILNSGKCYAYAAAAPGLRAEIRPSTEQVKIGAVSGCWTAVNAGVDEQVCSSAADDEFSLLDHAKRVYRPRPAAWVRVGKVFPHPLDLSAHQGMGVWIHGDGQGALANFRTAGLSTSDTDLDHYVPIDFSGWRYVELVEPESARFEDHSWPYGRSLYKTYRDQSPFHNMQGLSLWYNNVPVGSTVTCFLSPIQALPLVPQKLIHPRVTLGGRTVLFPVAIESGQVLEFRSSEDCTLYGPRGERIADVRPEGAIPTLEAGANTITFECDAPDCRPRARVTVISEGDAPL